MKTKKKPRYQANIALNEDDRIRLDEAQRLGHKTTDVLRAGFEALNIPSKNKFDK